MIEKVLMVIPCFNHGETLPEVVDKALAAGWNVLVVDDGSATPVAGLPCRVQRHPKNLGKGAAILTGARIAQEEGFDAILTMDADGQLDPGEAGALLEAAAHNPRAIVIGDRRMDGEHVPGSSRFGRAFSNFWVRMECGRDLPDTQSGFRLYPVEILLDLSFRRRRYDFEVEVLVRAAWAGFPIVSVPVSAHYPPPAERRSHFRAFMDNWRLTRLHTRLITRALNPWPHKRLIHKPPPPPRDFSWWNPISLFRRLMRENATPMQLAVAVWMGFFLGALPLIAVHTITIIYVTHKLHLNKVAAVAASQFCMPPVVPFLCIELGYRFRHGAWLTDGSLERVLLEAPERLFEWFLGSLVLGPLLGILGGAATYWGVRRLRARRELAAQPAGD